MNKLPLILTIVALLCATGLGFKTKQKADQKVRELTATHSELKSTQGRLTTTTGERDKANTDLATAEKDIEAKGTELTKLTGEVKVAKEDAEAQAVMVKEKAGKIASLEIEVSEYGAKYQAVEEAKTKLEAQLADAQREVTEARLAMDTLKKRLPEKPISSETPSEPSPRTTLRAGTILAVNTGLNYVVLSVGDQQGVSVNTPLVVVRGGLRVATLKVTSIEPRNSVAEVVPGTLARGQAVQVGDRVVPAGAGEQKKPSPSAAPIKVGSTSGRRVGVGV